MGQYFDNDSNVKYDIFDVKYYFNDDLFLLKSNNGVFSKNSVDFGTNLLLKTIVKEIKNESKICDLGCGIGVIGIILAKYTNSSVIFADVNQRALELTRLNNKTYNQNKYEVIESSCMDNIVDLDFDVVVTNPPIRAGKEIIYKFYQDAYDHLKKGGSIYLVIQKKQGAPSTMNKLEQIYGNCEVLAKDKGYFILKSTKN